MDENPPIPEVLCISTLRTINCKLGNYNRLQTNLYLLKKKIIICDRFIDSTLAYQVYGKGVNKSLIDFIHKYILGNIKPDLTFVLKVNISKALQRLKKRKNKNRYDKFSKNFYIKVQNAFIKMAKKDKGRYFIIDNSKDSDTVEKIILDKFLSRLNK